MEKKLINYISELAQENYANVSDYVTALQSKSAIQKVNCIGTVLLFVESKETSEKRLIEYMGEIDEVNYANVYDFFKDLQYNSPERNAEILEEVLLYVESQETVAK